MMGWADQRSRIRAAREAEEQLAQLRQDSDERFAATIARIEAADEVQGAEHNRAKHRELQPPWDPALAAQFAHLRTETFRRPEGWRPFGDEVPPPGGDAA